MLIRGCITLGLALWIVGVSMVNFDVIIGMEWLHACCVFISGRTSKARSRILMSSSLSGRLSNGGNGGRFISCLKVQLVSKGLHLSSCENWKC